MHSTKPDTPGVLAPPPLIFFACLLVGWGLGLLWPFELAALTLPVRLILGSAFFLVSVSLAISALMIMHRFNTPAESWKLSVRLVSSGPFRFTRNPIYIALCSALAGIASFTASGWIFAFVPILFFILDLGVVRREERYLADRFGQEYVEYTRRVRRWL